MPISSAMNSGGSGGLVPAWIKERFSGIFVSEKKRHLGQLEILNARLWNEILERETAADGKVTSVYIISKYNSLFPNPFDSSNERREKFEMLLEQFLNKKDRRELWSFEQRHIIDVCVCSISATFITRMYRDATKLTLAGVAVPHTFLPAAVLPALMSPILVQLFSHGRLMDGSVQCAPCHVAKSSFIHICSGFIHPVAIASLTCLYSADNYRTIPLPPNWLYKWESIKYVSKHWVEITKRMRKRLLILLLLNGIVGGLVSTFQMDTYYRAYLSLGKFVDEKKEDEAELRLVETQNPLVRATNCVIHSLSR